MLEAPPRPGRDVTTNHVALRTIRRLVGLSQHALAVATARYRDDGQPLSDGFIALVESGRRQPNRENAEAIHAALSAAAPPRAEIEFDALFITNGEEESEAVA